MNTFGLFSSKNNLKKTCSVKFTNGLAENPQIIEEKENITAQKLGGLFEKQRLSALEKLKKSLSSNLYQILQISPYADTTEIKKAYKKMSLKLHPDKNIHGNKEEFHQIAYAYKILSNVELRKVYDEQGLEVTEMIMSMYEENGQNLPQEMKI